MRIDVTFLKSIKPAKLDRLEKRLNLTQAQLDDCTAQLQHAKDVLAVARSSPDR